MTETPNLHLTKDAPEDYYSVDRVNANSDRIDTFAGDVNTALAGKQDALVVGTNLDSEPTAGSQNPVRSGGVVNYTFGTAANTIPTGANLNTYTAPGSYRCETGTIAASLYNCPTSSGFRMEVRSTIASAATGYQIQQIYPNNNDGVFYMRRRGSASSGTWGDWYAFQGTVVQAVNTPAGTLNISPQTEDA